MTLFLLMFLLWIPVASFVAGAVGSEDKQRSNVWKEALFIVLAAPVLWIRLIDILLSKGFGASLSAKIGRWFNS